MTKIRFKNSEVEFARFKFQLIHRVKTYSVFEVYEKENGNPNKLTDVIRIEQFRGKSNSFGIDSYLRLRDCSAWSKCTIVTGLRFYQDGSYYGDDRRGEKSLILFHFLNDGKTLIVDYFSSFYPYSPQLKYLLIDEIKKTLPKESAFTDLKIHQLDLFNKDRNFI